MNIRYPLMIFSLLLTADVFAQAEQTPENLLDEEEGVIEEVIEPEAPAEELPDTGVVDTNEDFFRRSMELQDQDLQRSPDLTTGTYSRPTGIQSLDRLPEESQKHLREQLREVIVENGPWTPEDDGTEYPYVASERAERNRTLAGREQAAWSEMVAEYHEREAAIHNNAARTQAATATGQNTQGELAQGESGQSSQPGENGEAGEGEQQDQDQARAERAAALAQMLNEGASSGQSSDQAPQPTDNGTEQNALQLLTQRNQVPAQAASPESQTSSAQVAQAQTTQTVEQSQSQSTEVSEEIEDEEMVIESIGVIAIEDLENVRVNPEDQEDN